MIEILTAGISHVTDLGRKGQTHIGVQSNGAADRTSAMLANILVGNVDSAPVVESLAFLELRLRSSQPLLIAVTGAAEEIFVDGLRFPAEAPVPVWPNATITLPASKHGLRSYLGVHGRLGADEFLGSVAYDPLIGRGTQLHDGFELPLTGGGFTHRLPFPYYPIDTRRQHITDRVEIGVLPGPELHEFHHAEARLDQGRLRVGTQSDHVGLRLDGIDLARTSKSEILSRGVPVGAIEVPPAGSMIVLLRGRPLTAGYPIPFIVGRGWHDRLGQLRPGDTVTLRRSTVARSMSAAQRDFDRIERVRTLCRTAFNASGLFISQ